MSNITLDPKPGKLKGKIYDIINDKVVPFVTVAVSGYVSLTGNGGEFLIKANPGTQTVAIRHPYYENKELTVEVEKNRLKELGTIDVTPMPGTVTGVTSPANATITLTGENFDTYNTTSDENGEFTIEGVIPDHYTLTVNASSHYQSDRKNIRVKSNQVNDVGMVTLYPKIGSISGTVIDSKTTNPIENAVVDGASGNVLTDSNGDFLLQELLAGEHGITVRADGYKSDNITNISVVPDETTVVDNCGEEGLIVLDPLESGFGDLKVEIFDLDDNPVVSDIQVIQSGNVIDSIQGVSSHIFTDLTQGPYLVKTIATGFYTHTNEVTVVSDQVAETEITLIEKSKMVDDLASKIQQFSENWNKAIGYPTEENINVSNDVSNLDFQLTHSSEDIYVGTEMETDANSFLKMTDLSYNNLVDSNDNDITITDLQDENGNTLLGSSKPVWYGSETGEEVHVILNATPSVSDFRIQYAVYKTMEDLAVDALIKRGVTSKETDVNVIDSLEDIKGIAWDETLASHNMENISSINTKVYTDHEDRLVNQRSYIENNAQALGLNVEEGYTEDNLVAQNQSNIEVNADRIVNNVASMKIANSTGLKFTGGDEEVNIAHSSALDITSQLTLEVFGQSFNLDNQKRELITKQNNYGIYLGSDRSINAYIYIDGTKQTISTDADYFEDNKPLHIVFDYDASTGDTNLYVNNELAVSNTLSTGSIDTNTNSIYLGGLNNILNGIINEFRIWNTINSLDTIKDNSTKYLTGDETNLVAYYEFDNYTESTIPDETGDCNDAVIDGPMWVGIEASNSRIEMESDRITQAVKHITLNDGSALDLNGTDSYIQIPASSNFSGVTEFTVEATVNPDNVSNTQTIAGFSGVDTDKNWELKINSNGYLEFVITDGSSKEVIKSDSKLTPDNINHITGRYKENQILSVELDGEFNSMTPSITLSYTSKDFYIGAFAGNSNYFKGQIYNFRFWNILRTKSEIIELSDKELDGTETNLTSLYNFKDFPGDILVDKTSNGNDGNISNPTWYGMESTSSQVKQLSNEYTVKIQSHANGEEVVSGFGLANNTEGESEFNVLADRFRVYGTTHDSDEVGAPVFAVDTTTANANSTGTVYISSSLIADGAIDADKIIADSAVITNGAQIANAVIDNAHINSLDVSDNATITGRLSADHISIGSNTTFEDGYNPKILEENLSNDINELNKQMTVFGNNIDQFTNDSKISRIEGNELGSNWKTVNSEIETLLSVVNDVIGQYDNKSLEYDTTNLSNKKDNLVTKQTALENEMKNWIPEYVSSYPIENVTTTDKDNIQNKFQDVQNAKSQLVNALTQFRETAAISWAEDEISKAEQVLQSQITSFSSDEKITLAEANALKSSNSELQSESSELINMANSLYITTAKNDYVDALDTLKNEVSKWTDKSNYPLNITLEDRTYMEMAFEDVQDTKSALIKRMNQVRADKTLTDAKEYSKTSSENFWVMAGRNDEWDTNPEQGSEYVDDSKASFGKAFAYWDGPTGSVDIPENIIPDQKYKLVIKAKKTLDINNAQIQIYNETESQTLFEFDPIDELTEDYKTIDCGQFNGSWSTSDDITIKFGNDLTSNDTDDVPGRVILDWIKIIGTDINSIIDAPKQYMTEGVPSNDIYPLDINVNKNSNGSLDVKLVWDAYNQGEKQADNLLLFWKKGKDVGLGPPTYNDTVVTLNVNTESSYYLFEGMPPNNYYSFGIAASRRTENGVEIGSIVSPASWQDVDLQDAEINYDDVPGYAGQGAVTIDEKGITGLDSNNQKTFEIGTDGAVKLGGKGEITSANESSRIDLADGTFNFGMGSLVWDGNRLTVVGEIKVDSNTTVEDYVSNYSTTRMRLKPANAILFHFDGNLTSTNGLVAEVQ